MSRLMQTMPAANLLSSSVFPMLLEAVAICLNSSSRRLKARMIEPSKASVILQIWEKRAPYSTIEVEINKVSVFSQNNKNKSIIRNKLTVAQA